MGTDIHGVFQARKNKKWKTIGEFYPHRNYDVFAILANVRNGSGFAGVSTGNGFENIDDPRGLPHGIDKIDPEHIKIDKDFKWYKDSWREKYSEGEYWLGDHSHTWMLLSEILAVDFQKTTVHTGVISEKEYLEWDKKTAPKTYCGMVFGAGIVVLEQEEYEDHRTFMGDSKIHIRVKWTETYAESVGKEFMEHIKELENLSKEYGGPENIRIVMGFDS